MPFYLEVYDPFTARGAKLMYPGQEIREGIEVERQQRFMNYEKYWSYYACEQYDKENEDSAAKNGLDISVRIPEHLRKHAYSGAIGEGIDFLTDQLVETASMEVETEEEERTKLGEKPIEKKIPREQEIGEEVWENSDMDLCAPDLTREALVSGDAYMVLVWDEINSGVKILPYDASSVNPIYSQEDYEKLERVEISYSRLLVVEGKEKQVDYKEEYILSENDQGFMECVKLIWVNNEDKPREVYVLGIPFIPIVHIRGMRKRVRQSFGDSLVEKVMRDADRFNAVCQLEFTIARYNSSGKLALFGEASSIKGANLSLGGEVADFWAFDNAISAQTIFLPTDVTMINSQKDTIERQIYRKIGLQKMEMEEMKGFGTPSGYALEIINRKTEGVFRRIRKELTKAFNKMFDMVLDMYAIKESGKIDFWTVNTKEIFKNRKVTFNFGSGFVVDDEQIRQDYEAGLISLKKALMLKGYSEEEAIEVMNQMKEEKDFFGGTELEGLAAIVREQQKQIVSSKSQEQLAQEKELEEEKVLEKEVK